MMFADDLKIYKILNSPTSQTELQQCIDKICEWGDSWQMSLAPKKCFALEIAGNLKTPYQIHGQVLQYKETVRDLGFLVDERLKFSKHVESICKKAFTIMRILLRSMHSKNEKVLVLTYMVYIRPILEYGTCAWNPSRIGDIERIEKVQNFMTRLIFYRCLGYNFDNRPSSTDRNKTLNLHTLADRRRVRDMRQAYSILFGKSPLSYILDEFYTIVPSRTRGSQFNVLPSCPAKTDVRKHSFANRTASELSKLFRTASFPLPFAEFMKKVRQG